MGEHWDQNRSSFSDVVPTILLTRCHNLPLLCISIIRKITTYSLFLSFIPAKTIFPFSISSLIPFTLRMHTMDMKTCEWSSCHAWHDNDFPLLRDLSHAHWGCTTHIFWHSTSVEDLLSLRQLYSFR